MLTKGLAILALLLLPLSVSLWHDSHRYPQQHRFDVTLYKSLRVYLRGGVCGLHLISMPTKTASRSGDFTTLGYDPVPNNRTLVFSSALSVPYRSTWLVFPLWLSTLLLAFGGLFPLLHHPVRQWHRRRNGRCLHCGYSLMGNRSGRCPECGAGHDRIRRPSAAHGSARTAPADAGHSQRLKAR